MSEKPNPHQAIIDTVNYLLERLERKINGRSSYDITIDNKLYEFIAPMTKKDRAATRKMLKRYVTKLIKKALLEEARLIPYIVDDYLNETDETAIYRRDPFSYLFVFGLDDPPSDEIVGQSYEAVHDQKGVPLSKDNHFVKSNLEGEE